MLRHQPGVGDIEAKVLDDVTRTAPNSFQFEVDRLGFGDEFAITLRAQAGSYIRRARRKRSGFYVPIPVVDHQDFVQPVVSALGGYHRPQDVWRTP